MSSPCDVILTSSLDGPIMAYEASSGATVAYFNGSRSPRRGLAMAGWGVVAASHVFSDTGVGSIHIYNGCSTPTVFHSFTVPEPVAPLAATSDSAFLFAGGLSGCIHSLSLSSGELIKSSAAHSKPVSSLQLSDDGSIVISGSDDGTITLIPTFRLVADDQVQGEEEENPKEFILNQWKAHSKSITAFSSGNAEGTTLVSCSLDCKCKFWTLPDGILLRIVALPCAIFGIAIDSTTTTEPGIFYAAGADGLIYKGYSINATGISITQPAVLDTYRSSRELVTLTKRHGGSIVSLVLVNSGKNLVSAAEDGSVWMWDVEKGEVAMVVGNDMGSISDMILAKGGNTVHECGACNSVGEEANLLFTSSGLCDEEMIRAQEQITELGDVMNMVVAQDKKRAIDMLESTIGMYERLLKLILKEAMKVIASNDDDDEEGEGQGEEGEKLYKDGVGKHDEKEER